MKIILKYISFAALIAMLYASISVFRGTMPKETYHVWALVGTVIWFVTVPFWMKRRLHH
jgi:hypothetical protein